MKKQTLSDKQIRMGKRLRPVFPRKDVRQFIKEILDEIEKSIDFINGKLDEMDLPEMTQANLSGGLLYLKSVKDLIKTKIGEELLK